MPNRSWLAAPLIAVVGSMGCSGSTTSNPGASDDGGTSSGSGDSGVATLGHTVTLLSSLGGSLSSLGGSVYSFQIDATSAYALVTSYDGNTDSTAIVKAPLSGGAAVTLATDPQYASGLALSGGALYWVDPSGPSDVDASSRTTGLVMSMPIAGGAPTTLASDQSFPAIVAADATGVYWVNENQCTQPPCSASVASILVLPPGASTSVVLANVQAQPSTLALDATNVYWGTSDGRVMKAPKGVMSGGPVTQLAYYETNVRSLVVGASNIYWATGTGDILATPIAGGPSSAIVVGAETLGGLAVDAATLYWIASDFGGTNTVNAIGLVGLGGVPTTLWSGSDAPGGIQVDDTNVYFTTESGSLWKLTPK
jgi:hypothetical protein